MSCRRHYMDEANDLVERHAMEVACITWNVNEARPDPSTGLHRWVIDLAKEASMFVVALQEIESGGGSLALAAAKDALLTKQQVSPECLPYSTHALPRNQQSLQGRPPHQAAGTPRILALFSGCTAQKPAVSMVLLIHYSSVTLTKQQEKP